MKMGRKKAKNKRNSELKVIFFIILIAAMLFIVSTYAWFSTQRNVSITNLRGKVEVAEGLEISLDAETWYNGIVIGDGDGEFDIVDDAYEGNRNLVPRELLPVSTLGLSSLSPDNLTDLKMMRGKIENSKILSLITVMDERTNANLATTAKDYELKYPGYFAFDIFLKNSSKNDVVTDELQLNYDSSLQIMSSELTDAAQATDDETERAKTGLQNTVRVALAKYGTTQTGVTDVNAGQSEILTATGALNNNVAISDVAIWEPNASDHVEYIVKNNNNITWSADDKANTEYGLTTNGDGKTVFTATSKIPTYALTDLAVNVEKIDDLYNWSGTNSTTLQKQTVLQTTKSQNSYLINEGVQNLISTKDGTKFTIPANSVCRMRIYIWLEGQDVDCINYASHGGGVELDLGLVKGALVGSHGEEASE